MGLKKISKFSSDYAYSFSQDEDRVTYRILDAYQNDKKRFKKFINDYNNKVKKDIIMIKKDAKKYKSKGIFYNSKGLLKDLKMYKLDGTIKK